MGLPTLGHYDRAKVALGNAGLDFTLEVLRAAAESNVYAVLENPFTSMLWDMPEIKSFTQEYSPIFDVVDFCQYGTPWRKRTALMSVCGQSLDLRVCAGAPGQCSRSSRPHVRLTGRDPRGVFWTLRAQPYPPQLTEEVARKIAGFFTAW